MPGLVATLAVRPGQAVKTGDLLMTLEAMKMETAVTSPRDGAVSELLVSAGQSVDAKELMAIVA